MFIPYKQNWLMINDLYTKENLKKQDVLSRIFIHYMGIMIKLWLAFWYTNFIDWFLVFYSTKHYHHKLYFVFIACPSRKLCTGQSHRWESHHFVSVVYYVGYIPGIGCISSCCIICGYDMLYYIVYTFFLSCKVRREVNV